MTVGLGLNKAKPLVLLLSFFPALFSELEQHVGLYRMGFRHVVGTGQGKLRRRNPRAGLQVVRFLSLGL